MFAGTTPSLLEFKAGKLNANRIGDTKKFKVEADEKKGKLVLVEREGSLHLMWKTRPDNVVVDDHLLLPNNQTFTKVNTGVDKDRVYLLQFNESSRRFFFWMQDADDKQDANICKKLNDYCTGNAPNNAGTGDRTQNFVNFLNNYNGSGSGGNTQRAIQVNDLSSILQEMNASGARGASARTSDNSEEKKESEEKEEKKEDNGEVGTLSESSNARQVTANDLQSALAGVSQAMQQMQPTPSLARIVAASDVRAILQDPSVQQELLQHLPENRRSVQELNEVVSSPQFRQSLMVLSHAIQSDDFNVVMANFGLNPQDGSQYLQRGDGIGAFLAALQAKVDRDKNNSEENDDFYN